MWVQGCNQYSKGQFLAAADLFLLAYNRKPAQRIAQNLGMAYFKAAQLSEYPPVLRLEYVRRALPHLRSYRVWLINDYGRIGPAAEALAVTNEHIAAAEQLERELRRLVEPLPRLDGLSPKNPR